VSGKQFALSRILKGYALTGLRADAEKARPGIDRLARLFSNAGGAGEKTKATSALLIEW